LVEHLRRSENYIFCHFTIIDGTPPVFLNYIYMHRISPPSSGVSKGQDGFEPRSGSINNRSNCTDLQQNRGAVPSIYLSISGTPPAF
jgi:hypothetical protein